MPPAKTTPATKATPKKPSNIYLVTFRGQYLNGNTEGGRSGFVNYQTTVKMTEEMVEFNAQSIFAGVLASTIMPQRYEDFRSLVTFNVVKTVREDGQPITNIKLLNRAELEDLIRRERMAVNVALYKDDEDLRQAILNYAKDKPKFLKLQQGLAPQLIERDKFAGEALALNAPELEQQDKNDVNKTVTNQPTLAEVVATKEKLDKKAKEKAIDRSLAAYDTPDTNKAKTDFVAGDQLMTDVLSQDEFPDGRHTIDGEPVNVGF